MPTLQDQARILLRSYALSVAVWLPLSLAIGSQVYFMDRSHSLPVVLWQLLLTYAVRYLCVAILTPPLFELVIRWPLTTDVLRRSGVYCLGFVAFSCAFALLRWLFLPPWIDETLSFGPRSLGVLLNYGYGTFADLLLAYVGIVVVAHAYTYFVRGRRQEIERIELQRSLAQSELRALRAQLHPHFLFNALQGIDVLIETDPPRAHRMLTTLGSLLRTVLRHGSADLVPLREELQFLQAYVSLEQMRFGNRLKAEWHVEPSSLGSLVPQLLLQPLVENAIAHGAASAPEGGSLGFRSWLQDDRLRVEITNTVSESARCGLGMGLANTRARLRYLYSEDAQLEFAVDPNARRAVASVSLPAFCSHTARREADACALA